MGPKPRIEHGMTINTTDQPPGVRVMCDGGREPKAVQKTATADAVVTRDVDGDEQDMIRVPISSTRADREGDRFTKDALEGMADQIRAENPMVFDNHGLAGNWMEAIPYDSRETIGAQMDAELESAEDGEWDLYSLVNPDGTHPEGERLLGQVRDEGQPIKFSVGFRVLDYDAIEDDAGNEIGREFTRSDLMETSRVGIPANPDASVTQSMTAKDGANGLPGYANHPMMQMLQAMGQVPNAERDAGTVAKSHGGKDAVDSEVVQDGTPVDVDDDPETTERDADDLREELEELRAEVEELRDEDGGSCDADADCPDGKVCVDGECVDESEASTDPDADTETDDGEVPEAVKELREQNKALKDEVSEIRAELAEGRGDAKTGDTDMGDDTPPETEKDTDADESDDEHKTAMDYARGS